MSRGKIYMHEGISLTLRHWAEVSGLSLATLDARLKRGWSFADAVSHDPGGRPRKGSRLFKRDGKKLSLSEWSRIFGMPLTTLHSRVSEYGWSFKDAVTLDAGERRVKQTGRAEI